MPTDWEWWYGHIDAESYAEPFKTRAQAIAAGLRDTTPGDQFQIIEAKSSTAQKYETGSHDVIPFTRTRNHEIITNGARPMTALSDQVRAMYEALRDFGRHDDDCELSTGLHDGNFPRCSCGLDTALASIDLDQIIAAVEGRTPIACRGLGMVTVAKGKQVIVDFDNTEGALTLFNELSARAALRQQEQKP